MFEACAECVKVPGHMKKRRTGRAPTCLEEFAMVAEALPPWGGGGGKGPLPFAPLTGNMVTMVVLHQLATRDSPPPPDSVGH